MIGFPDQNLNQAFDGNQTATDNEAIIFSSDNTLDASDIVKNTGTAFIKSFKYSSGVYEQYIDNNHSGTYTSGEAVVRTSSTDYIIAYKGKRVKDDYNVIYEGMFECKGERTGIGTFVLVSQGSSTPFTTTLAKYRACWKAARKII